MAPWDSEDASEKADELTAGPKGDLEPDKRRAKPVASKVETCCRIENWLKSVSSVSPSETA